MYYAKLHNFSRISIFCHKNNVLLGIKARRTRGRPKINYYSLWIEGRAGFVNKRNIENCLIGLNEVEVVRVFVVVLVGKDGRWGGNVWGKEKFLQESLQVWGKCGEN